jgi:hypothetical protein
MRVRLLILFLLFSYNSISGLLGTMVLPSLERPLRALIAGGDALMILMAFSVMLRNKNFYGVWLWIILVFGGVLTVVYNFDRFGIVAQLNGIRGPLFFLSALIVMHDIFESELRDRFARWFTAFLVVVAVIQTPTSIVEFVMYGAGDAVGGTYGTGGGSGMVTQILFLIVFYMLVRHGSLDEGTNFSISKLFLFSLFLVPIFVNETKISFVLIGLMVILVAFSRSKWYKAVPFLVLGSMLFAVFVYYYAQTVGDPTQIFTEKFIENYLYTAPKTQQGGDIPRLLRVSLMFSLFRDDSLAILIGMGYGIFAGGNVLEATRVARALYYLTTGSRILLVTVWLQGGLIALGAMIWGVFGFLRTPVRLTPTVRHFALFLAASLALVWIYNEALLDRTFAGVVAYMMAWIRHGGPEGEVIPEGEDESEIEQEEGVAGA